MVWFEAWILRDQASWQFVHLLLLLLNPTMLYILSHLLFPLDNQTNLGEHYFNNRRLLFGFVCAASVTGIIFHPITFGTPLFSAYHLSSILIGSGALVLAYTDRRWVHGVCLSSAALLVVFDIAVGGGQVS